MASIWLGFLALRDCYKFMRKFLMSISSKADKRKQNKTKQRKKKKTYMANHYSYCAYVNNEAKFVKIGLILQTN